jgi:hypothetical protein
MVEVTVFMSLDMVLHPTSVQILKITGMKFENGRIA